MVSTMREGITCRRSTAGARPPGLTNQSLEGMQTGTPLPPLAWLVKLLIEAGSGRREGPRHQIQSTIKIR
jgi:hypothetical protein